MLLTPRFKDKLANGDISLIRDDIACADLAGRGPFDYAEILNVLYLMTTPGQQLALQNISGSLGETGKLMMNDRTVQDRPPVLERNGGWLDKKALDELGLEEEKRIAMTQDFETVLFRKK